MAAKKKTKKEEVITPVEVEEIKPETKQEEIIDATAGLIQEIKEKPKKTEKKKETPKYDIGSIVYIHKNADADLNGFKLFPQYKKYTYTVEAYEPKSGVYSLRRLNLSLRLPEALIINPDEHAHDSINRKQF